MEGNSLFKKPAGNPGPGAVGTVRAAAAALNGFVTPPPHVSRRELLQRYLHKRRHVVHSVPSAIQWSARAGCIQG